MQQFYNNNNIFRIISKSTMNLRLNVFLIQVIQRKTISIDSKIQLFYGCAVLPDYCSHTYCIMCNNNNYFVYTFYSNFQFIILSIILYKRYTYIYNFLAIHYLSLTHFKQYKQYQIKFNN